MVQREVFAVVILVAALAAPSAAAFTSTTREILIAYDASATPIVVGAGEVRLVGDLTGRLLLEESTTTALTGIDSLRVATAKGSLDVHEATLEISRGALLWRFTTGSLAIDVAAPYALALAHPEGPIPSETGAPAAGFLLAGEDVRGSARWSGGSLELVPLDAIITIRDAHGQPVPDWDAREVNKDVTSAGGADDLVVTFLIEGAFDARIGSSIVAGAAGSAADLTLHVGRAEEDRFAQTVALLERTASAFSEEAPGIAGDQGPLAVLQRVSGILNGALLLVPGDGSTAEAIPRESRWGADEFAVGAFNMMRGDDLGVAWREGEMRIQGEPTVALGREGFAVDPPARLGIFPIVSVLLWAIAFGALVFVIVKRPPKGVHVRSIRLLSFAVYVAVLLGAVWLWDRSFTATFGTGVLASAREQGINAESLPQIATLGAIELVPWGTAALLFALPVRIALGVGLRYLGRGKSYKGVATAGGLVSLAILGPFYALWCFSLLWAQAGRVLGHG